MLPFCLLKHMSSPLLDSCPAGSRLRGFIEIHIPVHDRDKEDRWGDVIPFLPFILPSFLQGCSVKEKTLPHGNQDYIYIYIFNRFAL